MRRMIIAGNWKMYKDLAETTQLIIALKDRLRNSLRMSPLSFAPVHITPPVPPDS